MQWSNLTKCDLFFQHSLPPVHTLLLSVLQGLDSHGIEALILILEKSPQLQMWLHHRSDTASQPSAFLTLGNKIVRCAKSGESGGWSISSKPRSRTAAIATTDLCAGGLSWWNRTPFVSFPDSFEMSLILLFKVLNYLSSVSYLETMQLVLGKVEFNACEVSLLAAQLLLSQPMNFLAHPHMCSLC